MSGLVHIYCGEGKGKTTAAVGLAVRAAGHGMRVLFLQFLKSGTSSELASLQRLEQVTLLHGEGVNCFVRAMDDKQKQSAKELQRKCFHTAVGQAQEYDMLVLDEAIGACSVGFLEEGELCSFLERKPKHLEVVLTGRYPSETLMEHADYISQIQSVRHPYDKGITAREGIEK